MQQRYKLAMSEFRKGLRSTVGINDYSVALRAGSFKGYPLRKFVISNIVNPVSVKIWLYLDDKLNASS